MNRDDFFNIPTKGDLQLIGEAIISELNRLVKPSETIVEGKFFSIDEAAAFTGHERSTVLKWMKKGKLDNNGKLVKLTYSEFSPGFPRIAKIDLIAFGQIGTNKESIKRKNNLPNNKIKKDIN